MKNSLRLLILFLPLLSLPLAAMDRCGLANFGGPEGLISAGKQLFSDAFVAELNDLGISIRAGTVKAQFNLRSINDDQVELSALQISAITTTGEELVAQAEQGTPWDFYFKILPGVGVNDGREACSFSNDHGGQVNYVVITNANTHVPLRLYVAKFNFLKLI